MTLSLLSVVVLGRSGQRFVSFPYFSSTVMSFSGVEGRNGLRFGLF